MGRTFIVVSKKEDRATHSFSNVYLRTTFLERWYSRRSAELSGGSSIAFPTLCMDPDTAKGCLVHLRDLLNLLIVMAFGTVYIISRRKITLQPETSQQDVPHSVGEIFVFFWPILLLLLIIPALVKVLVYLLACPRPDSPIPVQAVQASW